MARARREQPATAHQAAAAAAARAQVQPPQNNFRHQGQTEPAQTTNRICSLTRFKPGFELETERELSIIFHRPPRTYKEDPPFYPWLPPEPYVNFNLNYKL